MPLFVVQRELPGITPEMLTSAGLRANTCCAEISQEGRSVRWIRSYFLPESSQTHCYFEGANKEVVEEANKRANIPFVRITEVVEMSPESLG
jgi:hypothetical protein